MRSLVLASQSPRRRDLLKKQGFVFHTYTVEISEILNKNLSLDDAIMDLARQKAEAVVNSGKLLEIENYLLLSGDTMVILEDDVLGKPKSEDQAFEFLSRLSGITHRVKTGICLWDGLSGEVVLGLDTSEITFQTLTDQQIRDYIATGDPMDKAGAYGIQSMDRNFIQKIEGSVENVMGLPVQLLERLLKEKGWDVDRQ